MKEGRKYSTAEILAVVLCAIGCLLFASPLLMESELDLRTIGLAINGVGLFLFLYSRRSKQA